MSRAPSRPVARGATSTRARAIGLGIVHALVCAGSSAAQSDELLVHVASVVDQYFDTPDGRGLLPTALSEAEIAAEYASLAAADSAGVAAMRRYATYVLNAMDPTLSPSGPGLGYGVRAATSGALRELEATLAFDSVSDNVRLHAGHAAAAARNVLRWTDEVVALAGQVRAAGDRGQAASAARRLALATDNLLRGVDGNGDGRRGWPDGEEGLKQAAYHMTLLKRGEGLIG